jgi:F0F1-type ATP synthase membrane subunit a
MEQFELYTISFSYSAIFFMIVASLLCLRALTLTSFSISGNWWATLNESLYHTLLAMTRDYIGPKLTPLFPLIFLPFMGAFYAQLYTRLPMLWLIHSDS